MKYNIHTIKYAHWKCTVWRVLTNMCAFATNTTIQIKVHLPHVPCNNLLQHRPCDLLPVRTKELCVFHSITKAIPQDILFCDCLLLSTFWRFMSHLLVVHSFLLLRGVHYWGYNNLFIHSLVVWVVPSFGLLWIKWLHIFWNPSQVNFHVR